MQDSVLHGVVLTNLSWPCMSSCQCILAPCVYWWHHYQNGAPSTCSCSDPMHAVQQVKLRSCYICTSCNHCIILSVHYKPWQLYIYSCIGSMATVSWLLSYVLAMIIWHTSVYSYTLTYIVHACIHAWVYVATCCSVDLQGPLIPSFWWPEWLNPMSGAVVLSPFPLWSS